MVSWEIDDQYDANSVEQILDQIIRDHLPICICLQHVHVNINGNNKYNVFKSTYENKSLITLYLKDSLIRMTHLYALNAPFQRFIFKPNFTVFNVAMDCDNKKFSTSMIRLACADHSNIIMFGDVGSVCDDDNDNLILYDYRGRGIECFVPSMKNLHNERPYKTLQGINVVSFV